MLSSNTPLPALFCPCLESLITYGVPGKEIKELLHARLKLGVPLKQVLMSQEDALSMNEERWIREHVEEFKLLERQIQRTISMGMRMRMVKMGLMEMMIVSIKNGEVLVICGI